MTFSGYSRQQPRAKGIINFKSTKTNPAFNIQGPALLDKDGKLLEVGLVDTGYDFLLSDIVDAVQAALERSGQGYISTTKEAIQAKYEDKFQIIENGNILLPTTLKDGGIVTVIDPYRKLRTQANRVIAGEVTTIGKSQLDAGLEDGWISLQNDYDVARIEFVSSIALNNWAVLAYTDNGNRVSFSSLYRYTTTADIQAIHGDLIEIDKLGKILLWNAAPNEYLTITDGRGLLAAQDNVVLAPAGDTIGKNQIENPTNELHLKNDYFAQWIRLVKDFDNNWIINTVTK